MKDSLITITAYILLLVWASWVITAEADAVYDVVPTTSAEYATFHIARIGMKRAKHTARRNDMSIRHKGRLITGEPVHVYLKIRREFAGVGIKVKI